MFLSMFQPITTLDIQEGMVDMVDFITQNIIVIELGGFSKT